MPKKTAKKPTNRKKSTAVKLEPSAASQSSQRVLQAPKPLWYKPQTWRRQKPALQYARLPKAQLIFMKSFYQIKHDWVLFGGIVLIYGILNLILVRGLSGSSDLSQIKSTLDQGLHGFGGKLASTAASFSYLVASSGSSNAADSGTYQTILLVVCSLAFIWTLRQATAGNIQPNKLRIRDSFYQGMYPLIPFLLIVLLLLVQLLPLAITGGLYSLVNTDGIAINWLEKLPFLILFIAGGLWTLRMLTASIFALYIVTLPNMTPMRAYRSARDLVRGRRLYLWRKLIFLPVALLLIAVIIMFPLILWLTPLAEWAFFVLSMLALPFIHGYLYNLYREMI